MPREVRVPVAVQLFGPAAEHFGGVEQEEHPWGVGGRPQCVNCLESLAAQGGGPVTDFLQVPALAPRLVVMDEN